jgi:hypothetical protein
LLFASRGHWIYGQFQALAMSDYMPLPGYWLSTALNAVLLLAFPLLLIFLFRAETIPEISNHGRSIAIVVGALVVLIFTLLSGIELLSALLMPSPGRSMQWFGGTPVADQLWEWIREPWTEMVLWRTISLASWISLAWFLYALARFRGAQTKSHSLTGWRVAKVIWIIAGSAVLIDVAKLGYYAVLFRPTHSVLGFATQEANRAQLTLMGARELLPNVCSAAIAWVVYRGFDDQRRRG